MSRKKVELAESRPVDAARMASRLVSRFHCPFDDALQDVRLSLLEHGRLYSGLACPPCDENRWLYNKVWQQLRHRYTRARRKAQDAREGPLLSDVPNPSPPDQDAVLDVRDALKRLSEEHRSILTACGLEGRTLSEFAQSRGVSASSVSAQWSDACAALRSLLPEYSL